MQLEFIGKGEVRGFSFKQLASSEKGFVYEVSVSPGIFHYEVFLKKINQFGSMSYPKSKSFGRWAWSFCNIDRARAKFEELG